MKLFVTLLVLGLGAASACTSTKTGIADEPTRGSVDDPSAYLTFCEEVLAKERPPADPGSAEPAEVSLNYEICQEIIGEARETTRGLCEEALAEKRKEIRRDRSLSGASRARMRASLDNYRCD